MAEPFDIGKLFRGFNIFSGAVFGKLLQQVIVWIICGAVAYGIYWKVFKQRTEEHNQTAQQITNVQQEDKDGFNLIKIKLFGFGN